MKFQVKKTFIFFILTAIFFTVNAAFGIETDNNEINLLALKTKLGNQEVVYFSGMTSQGGLSSMYSVEWNDSLSEFKDYVDQKWDGDFSAIIYDGLIDKLKDGDFIKISEEI